MGGRGGSAGNKGTSKKASTLSDLYKAARNKDLDFFLGEGNYQHVSNKYMTFKRVIDDNNILIVTSNVKMVKDSLVMMVDNNKAVYLKDWQVRKAFSWDKGIDSYVVKLNRNYFKPYTFKSDFKNVYFKKADTFDSLLADAKAQQKTNLKMKISQLNMGDYRKLKYK